MTREKLPELVADDLLAPAAVETSRRHHQTSASHGVLRVRASGDTMSASYTGQMDDHEQLHAPVKLLMNLAR